MTAYWAGKKFSISHRRNLSRSHKGLKLGPQTQAHKDASIYARLGFIPTPEQRKRAKLEKHRRANRRLKEKLCRIYGCKCANSECRWKNKDGSFGCTDIRILQLDHKLGGGSRERSLTSSLEIYRKAIKKVDKRKYQILCPNCNWIKRMEQKEYPHHNLGS